MSFLLRAALVIGALSYLAMERGGGPAPSLPSARDLVAGLPADTHAPGIGSDLHTVVKGLPDLASSLPAAWNALPPEARERAAREGLAILAGQTLAPSSSRDTLAEADRLPQWQGPLKPVGRSGSR